MQSRTYAGAHSYELEIPEEYQAMSVTGVFHFSFAPDKLSWFTHGLLSIGNRWIGIGKTYEAHQGTVGIADRYFTEDLYRVRNKLGIALAGANVGALSVTMNITCTLTVEAHKKWQQECFQAIIEAYNVALKAYKEQLALEQNKAVEIKRTNPGFYRQIENIVLRKNCIAYLTRFNDMGKSFTSGKGIEDFAVQQNKELEAYASLAKFMEQAFEWDTISYNFYPSYWGDKGHWAELYTYEESDDPIFRSFMQSGMARVVATVRPGFEEAVQLYMSTGKIWNGGEIPVIGDELYLSLIDEVRQAETVKEGKAWITRIPTSLTILQAKSAGLEVEKALPCNCDDTADFEDPSQVPCSDAFVLNDNLIGGDTGPEPEN